MATYTYLPWVRQGLIGAVAGKPLPPGAVTAGAVKEGRIELQVHANVAGKTVAMAAQTVGVLLFGARDVTGFDARQVIRTDPPHLTSDFEPNYFPLIEFDRPDFPWLFTPAAPDSHDHLQPWICLIVVERRDGVEIIFQEGQPLPVLTIAHGASKELPNLSEAWAWAHAQISTDGEVSTALESQPERTLARLICPRHLKGKTAYYACVVPTYKGGVQAGLGEPVIDATVQGDAWDLDTLAVAPSPDSIRLPVYYHWEFATGAQGDFEALVWQLEHRQLSFEEVGTRKLDISHAGYDLPAGDAVDLAGVLGPQAQADMVGPSIDYQKRLQVLLNETEIPSQPVLPHETTLPSQPVLPPPIYGRWAAAQRAIPDTIRPGLPRDRAWLRAINLEPRYRVAAGLGAQIVRDQQEQLMASAWEQVGDIERANQILRQAQLACAASTSIYQERLVKLDAPTFLLITGAVHSRVRLASTQTARGAIQASNLPVAATSAQFRRMLRPRGVIARRFGIANLTNRNTLIARLNLDDLHAAPRSWPTPDGMVTMKDLLDRRPCQVAPQTLAQAAIDAWPPEQLITMIKQAFMIFDNGRAEISGFSQETQEQLEQAAKHLSDAYTQLIAYVTEVGQTDKADVKLILFFYKPALTHIAEAWSIIRVVSSFQPKPPPIITDLEMVMKPLPPPEQLITMSEQAFMVFDKGRAEISGFSQETQEQLEQAEKRLSYAHAQLTAYVTEIGQPGSVNVKLFLSLYKPALMLIAEACWLVARVAGSFQSTPPPIITDLAVSIKPLPLPPPEQLITMIEQAFMVFDHGRTEIGGFSQETQAQLEEAAKDLFHAREQLTAYMTEIGQPGSNLELFLSLYKPALMLIAKACWLVARVVSRFQLNPPAIITDMEVAMKPLLPADELRTFLFRLAALEHLQQVEPCDDATPPTKPLLNLELFQLDVRAKLNPAVTIATRVGMLIQAPGWKADDLDFVLAAPDFPAPMYKELAKLSQEWMLPGLERIPQNTLTLVESNNRFIEAFMVGLNHEMSRELLWRGYPTDQRGTYFRQFWDASGRFPVARNAAERKDNLEKGKDIPPIHEWGDAALGNNFGKQRAGAGSLVPAPAIAQIVLLIRGDLLRRYPRASIFMVKAKWDGAKRTPVDLTDHTDDKDETKVVYPLFHGELSPDITFLGFPLSIAEAIGDDEASAAKPGWFIVIQQPPTEPRYGLDETLGQSTASWRDLAWPHINLEPNYDYIKLSRGLMPSFLSTAQIAPPGEPIPTAWQWLSRTSTTDSAQLTCITLQGPVRISIHASDLLQASDLL
jgi:hypothetical protein